MKLEQNTDYETYKTHKRLIILFNLILLAGLIAIVTIILKYKTIVVSDNELKQGIVPSIAYYKENARSPMCDLDVVDCDNKIIEIESRGDSEQEEVWTAQGVCNLDNSFKSFMDYRMITDTSSPQYKLQQHAYTNKDGLREYEGMLMIAIAGYNVGDQLKLILDNGKELEVIVGDIKANTGCLHEDGSLVEFIVYTPELSPKVCLHGDLSVLYKGNIQNILRKEIWWLH